MKRYLILLAVVVFGAAQLGANTKWTADPTHSRILFSTKYLVLTDVTGTFGDFSAALNQTKDDFEGSSFEATVKVASINTENARRDGHLKSGDFFDAENHPEITFKSTSFTKTGKDIYKLKGELTMRGVTKPVEFDVTLVGTAKDMQGNDRVAFRGTARVNRMDFGVKWNRALETGGVLVSENVDITLNVQFIKQ
jgi:polyisoprenoid-binding protein YceI